MSTFILATAILAFCPGHDTASNGDWGTTACQERMVNCVINKAGNNEPTKKEFNSCTSELKSKYGSSDKVTASSLLDK